MRDLAGPTLAMALVLGLAGCILVEPPVRGCMTHGLVWHEPGIWENASRLGFEVLQPSGLTPVPLLDERWNATAALVAVRYYTTEAEGNAAPHVAIEWHDGQARITSEDLEPVERREAATTLLESLSLAPGATKTEWIAHVYGRGTSDVTGPFRFDEHFASTTKTGGLYGFGYAAFGRMDAAGFWGYEFDYATGTLLASRLEVSADDEATVGGFDKKESEQNMTVVAEEEFRKLGLPPPAFQDANVGLAFGRC